MTKNIEKAVTTLPAGFVLLVGIVTIPQLATAQEEEFFMSKLRALQDGNVIRIDDNVEGAVGFPVDCVGGIASSANADTMKCYLISDESRWASEYKTDPTVLVQEGVASACPEVGFEASKDCFLTTFDASNFAGHGKYRFVAEFYKGDTLLDIAKDDYRLQSFFVLPESGIGAIALIGSSLGAFGAYKVLSNRRP